MLLFYQNSKNNWHISLILTFLSSYSTLIATDLFQNSSLEHRFPQALIIGAKKCGTRAVLEFLRLNPNIQAPFPEIHFFDKNFNKGYDWYRKQMPLTTTHQITLEKSPSYFVDKKVPVKIYNFNPKMKLILVVRNPITRAISDYTQTLANRKNSSLAFHSFEQLVTCENRSWKGNNRNCVNGVNTSASLIKIGMYQKHLKNWLKWFPLEQILVIDGELMISKPAKELNRAEKFLGLDPVISEKQFTKDPIKGFPCTKDKQSIHCLGKTKGRRHKKIKPDVLKLLQAFYKVENEKLYQLVNKRYDWR